MRARLENAAVGELVAGVRGSCFAEQARSRAGQVRRDLVRREH